ncbi:patatin [Glutamicibacter uratoxydans]|uniref:Patatin n=1 Tax=Glutamicibacter uratoxydans TaxID=43667 RepID=A0A4Y4DMF5_GLUUR|nr:patatin-like phospholipase family protein [Glutamicibacter uratoxydans]GED06116.1 patatin [Glutamicibacter uratoxydans]
MNTSLFPVNHRALVLGGGGSTGNAWLIGVIAGLESAGLDVSQSELTVGTSAGATAAAQLAGSSAEELYEAAIQTPAGMQAPRKPAGGGRTTEHLARIQRIIDFCSDIRQLHRAMSAAALELPGARDLEFSTRWRGIVEARFPGAQWPEHRKIMLAAVDATAGEPAVFGNNSAVALADAVAASCSSSLPYWIGGKAYIDGGYRCNENADLASGYVRVLVLSPLGGRSLHPESWGTALTAQVRRLRSEGSQVQVLLPDEKAQPYMGAKAMDLSLRPAAAREGFRQGRQAAAGLAQFWG